MLCSIEKLKVSLEASPAQKIDSVNVNVSKKLTLSIDGIEMMTSMDNSV